MGSISKIFGLQNKVFTFSKLSYQVISLTQRSLTDEISEKEVKRPSAPFGLFYKDKLSEVKRAHPNTRHTEIMKLVSVMWNNESSFTQQQYKNEYSRRMQEYKETQKDIPKRPITPFMKFVHSDNNRSIRYQYRNVIARSKKLAELWKNLSQIEKDRYKSAYAKELKQFKENLTDEEKALMQGKRNLANEKRVRRDIRRFGKKALEHRPKHSLCNPYSIFIYENASKVPEVEKKNLFAYLSTEWRNLSEKDKSVYTEKFAKSQEIYQKELTQWENEHDRRLK